MDLRTDALSILQCALAAVDPAELFRRNVRVEDEWLEIPPCPPLLRGGKKVMASEVKQSRLSWQIPPCIEQIPPTPLNKGGKIVVVGTGKGTAPMAQAAEELLGDRISAGAITVKYGHGLPLKTIKVYEAGHPIPDQATLEGTTAILDLIRDLQEDDLVLVLITGGGSALLELPAEPLNLQDMQTTTSALLACGADITEMNAVRKHLSQVKGGRLAQAAWPAKLITLAISDVIGDPPEAISSGPTAPDPTTFAEAWRIVEKYSLPNKLPGVVINHLKTGLKGEIPDTPKASDSIFAKAVYRLIGSNRIMLEAARQTAEKLGYRTEILTDQLFGEAREQGRRLTKGLIERHAQSPGKPLCLLAGGETTVTIRGDGKGGRNQELALSAAIELTETEGCLLLSAGSDGTDGPTDAAGAIADGTTIRRAQALSLNAQKYLDRNDSYPFFQALGDLVITGPTRTNVMDMVIMLRKIFS